MIAAPPPSPTDLARAIEAAARTRARLDRSPGDVARALAEAAARWRGRPGLLPALARASGLGSTMLATALDHVVAPFDAAAMETLARRERTGAPPPPPVVAYVLASNVPALALPAIAHALLAGTAVALKSGRADRHSALAFCAALAEVDAELAATVVTASWPRGDRALDAALLAAAPICVLTGTDATIATLATGVAGRVLAFGTRTSAALLTDLQPDAFDALAVDVALYEQRGCLSPHVAFVVGDADAAARGLAAALERLATRWPPPARAVDTRASRRAWLEEARWSGATVHDGTWGAIVVEAPGAARPGPGDRVLRLQPLDDVAALCARLPQGTIESLGTTGPAPAGLAARGLSRVCRLGAMQRPTLAWPRGGRPPIRMLLDPDATATMEDDR